MDPRQIQSTSHSRSFHSAGFTLVELLVVIAIIGVLVALLLPAVQAAREAARRSQCLSNQKQIGIAFQNYHDAKNELPYGAHSDQAPVGRGAGGSWGSAWTVWILPYLEQSVIYDQLRFGWDENGASYNNAAGGSGWPNPHNYLVVGDARVSVYQCPSSPIEERPTIGNPNYETPGTSQSIMLNHYVGISGVCLPLSPADEFLELGFSENRRFLKTQFGAVSAGGTLFAGGRTSIKEITDGTSNTMIVSEQNDFLTTSDGRLLAAGAGIGYGWLLGSNKSSTITLDHPQRTSDWRAHQCTTIRYLINQKNGWPYFVEFDAPSSNSRLNGVGVMGTNTPINSAHPGGVHALFVDGSVRFVNEDLPMRPLAAIATRDDGQVVSSDLN